MKAKASRKKKSNVVYISSYKKRNVVKAYTKTDDDWYQILRANDAYSKVSFKAARLVGKLILELHKNNDRSVYKDNYWFSKIVNVSSAKQNKRIRDQIEHIFNFPFHKIIVVDGALLKDVYEISFTKNAYKILNFEDIKIDKKDVEVNAPDTASNRSLHRDINVSIHGHKCPSYMYDKEKEEEPLGYSSSFSNNEKLKIKSFSEFEETPQEEITEIPTLATGYPTEPAKVHQTEETRSEAMQAITVCNRFGGFGSLQAIPILANVLSPCAKRTPVDNLSTTHPEKHEEIIQMKNNQITQEPERNMEFELSNAIFKSFGGGKSDKIMENCKFILINPSKFGVQVSNGFNLSENDKDLLKACIRLVYGDSISIISSTVLKIIQPLPKILEKPRIESNHPKWIQFRNDLLNYLPEKVRQHCLNAWFDKLGVREDEKNNKIILTGSRFYVDSIHNRFENAIECVVKKNKVTLELHFENNDERPIIYKPNRDFK